jgi:hypothetical protein
LRPKFENVKAKAPRNEEGKQDQDECLSDEQSQLSKDIEVIMAALSQKGNIVDSLKELLSDRTKVKTDGV